MPAIELTEEEIQWLHAHLGEELGYLDEPEPEEESEQATLYRLMERIITALEPGGA